jgi:hypothetical protein
MLNESWTMHYYKRQMMGKRVQLKEKTPINFRNRCQTPRQSWWALKQERRMGTLANQQINSQQSGRLTNMPKNK